jgi:hypothetical protein
MALPLEGADTFVVIMTSHTSSVSINFCKLKFMDIKGNEPSKNLEISAKNKHKIIMTFLQVKVYEYYFVSKHTPGFPVSVVKFTFYKSQLTLLCLLLHRIPNTTARCAQIQAATQNFSVAVNNASSNVSQISSQFTTCLGAGVFSVSICPSCTATAKMQVTSASTALDAAFQSSKQILSQVSASATGGNMAQALNQTTYLAQTQLQQVSQQRTKCLQQAAASDTPAAAAAAVTAASGPAFNGSNIVVGPDQ